MTPQAHLSRLDAQRAAAMRAAVRLSCLAIAAAFWAGVVAATLDPF